MPPTTKKYFGLSEHACILLAYFQRYDIHHDEREVEESLRGLNFIRTNMRDEFPLLAFLFDSENCIRTAMDELEDCGVLQAFNRLSNHDVLPDPIIVDEYLTTVDHYIKDHAEDILNRVRLDDIDPIFASEGNDSNVTTLRGCLESRGNSHFERAARISHQYAQAVTEPLVLPTGPIEKHKLIDLFTDGSGLTLMEEKTKAVKARRAAIKWFRAERIVPCRHLELCFAVLNSDHDHSVQIQELADEKPEAAVILNVGRGTSFRKELSKEAFGVKKVLLEHADLKRIALSKDIVASLRSQILRQLPLRFLSPYRTTGPVRGDIFFGRVGELRAIVEMPNTNYCVLGPRRIGKTSFLHALRNKINEEEVLRDTVAIYVDACEHNRMVHFQKHLTGELSKENDFVWIDPSEAYFEDLADFLRQSPRKFVFLLDEVDRLLQSREADSLEAFARSMANEGYARFIFCGYKALSERIRNRMSPIYNLFDLIRLGPLNVGDARELVRQPMDRIGVRFEKPGVIDRILDLGSNVPWLLQFLCQLLVERLEVRGGAREIAVEDVDFVYNSSDFSKAMTEAITDEDMPVLMRLIIYLVVDSPEESLRERDIYGSVRKAVYGAPFTEIRKALDYLAASYVLKNTGDHYRFYIPQLKQKLKETEPDLPFVISSLATEYRESLAD